MEHKQEYILNYIKRDNLDIVLIDNSERADIEFVAINEYVDAEVTVNNAKDGLIYAKDANDEVHKLPITAATGDVDLVRIYDAKTGSEESAESIKPGNLISFCKSTISMSRKTKSFKPSFKCRFCHFRNSIPSITPYGMRMKIPTQAPGVFHFSSGSRHLRYLFCGDE